MPDGGFHVSRRLWEQRRRIKLGVDRTQNWARRSYAAPSSVETADEACDLLQGRKGEEVLWRQAVSDSV